MTRKRKAVTVLASLAGLVLLAIGIGFLVLQSSWFYEKARGGIITTIADATGGRVGIGAFHLDWKRMQVELTSLEIAGKEPAGKPPLFHADSIVIGLKIVSLLKRDVDIQFLEVRNPHVYLIVYPDGGTNLPEPKVKRAGGRTMETVLKLAVQRFHLQNGVFEVESQGKTPFDARGQNLSAALQFEPAAPRYRGDISVQQLNVGGAGYQGVWSVAANVALEKDRITFTSARLSTGASYVQAAGAIDNLAAPHAEFHFDARVAAADAGHALRIKLLERGTVDVAGTARWAGGTQYSLNGKLHAYNLDYGGAYVQLREFRADSDVSAGETGILLSAVRLSGTVAKIAVSGGVERISFRAGDLGFQGIGLAALGGTFRGEARLREFDRFQVTGEIAGVEARRAVALYSPQALPWNSLVTGKVSLEGLLQRKNELRTNADLVLEPAPDSAPVRGQISAAYDTRTAMLDIGRANVTLPSSRAEFSGALGQQIRVHLETHDFDDLLPLLGEHAAALPIKLENGAAIFDGTVTGKLDDPQAAGHVTARSFLFRGEKVDSLAADVTLSAQNAAVRNATIARGSLSAQLEADVQLHDWKAEDSSLIAGSGSLRNAGITDLVSVTPLKQTPLTGTLSATAQVNGTIGNPIVKGDLTASKGTFLDEPFDQFTAHVEASGRTLVASNAQFTAGAKQVKFGATYDHPPDSLATGRLRFEVQSNSMPLEAIETVRRDRPDVKGSAQISANGAVDVVGAKNGDLGIRVSDLHGDVTARGLRLADQVLGDAHLTANTQGQFLRAHLDSDFAGSSIKGDGEWRLEGDYPGSATVAFSRIDLAQLRAWLTPAASGISESLAGWAEGQLRFDGPALKPGDIKAQLRIPNLEIGGAPGGSVAAASLTLHNSGPIVASMSNSTITVDSMRLVGHDSDLGVSGKISLQQRTSDLRVSGHVDLAIVHDLNRDFRATGVVTADATIRGSLTSPAISGRTEFHNATFQVADLPNGLSGANGVILFSGDRATIQSFSGDTGGGKVDLFGFAGYGGGQTIFRIHARAQAVRVRYPEGVSTVADASLNLTGAPDHSMLAGTVTVLRTGFNPQSDFSSLITQSAQPVETPSARAGFLGGLSFDIQINTAPDIEFQSSLAQDVEVEANLRLRGTFSNPALLGRANLTQGQIIFFGTRYTITQGSISFFNPLRVEPIFDVNLETKARGIDITLAVTGPLNKLNLTPLSDPPLQFNEIVALLATGRTPTNDPALLSQQATAPQSWQQMGASALLGQAIASPVAGRLQRFFGVSQLRIDPSLPGVENTPQARLTLEQQITPDITFTYITNVSASNYQVVRVEWAFSKQWSAVALREENGIFGIDFFYKRRF